MTMIENTGAILIWVIIGILMAVLFLYSQEKSIALITSNTNHFSFGKIFQISFLRIAAISAILLFAFHQSITFGLVCLISFIVSRWVTLLFLLRKANREV
jgi:uncharacterized membrane protein YedE/YeeE